MKYLVRIGAQTLGPMLREDVLRHASGWQNGSLPVSVAPEGTQNFVPLAQFIAGTQPINPSPTFAGGGPPPPIFGQSPQQPQQAQPLSFSTQPPYQPWQQTPAQPHSPLPWQQSPVSSTSSASKSSAPFVTLVIGGSVVIIIALLLIGGFLYQRKQAELAQQIVTQQQQEEEQERKRSEEAQAKLQQQQDELQRQEAARRAEATTALDDADTALQAAENEARSAPGDFSDDFHRLRSDIVEARKIVSRGDYDTWQESASRIKTQIQQVRAKVTKAIDTARIEEEISRAKEAILDRMRTTAQDAAASKHPLTDEENTIQGEEKITYRSDTRVDFSVNFDCRRVGSILGRNHFSVGVEVSGRLEKSGQYWKGYVLGSHVTHDMKM